MANDAVDYNNENARPLLGFVLDALGFDGEPPAIYDTNVVARVTAFQRTNGLVPDGKIGPNTRTALLMSVTADATSIWPLEGADPALHYAQIARRAGFLMETGRPWLLGLRGVSRRERRTHAVFNGYTYTDAFAFMDGSGHVTEFVGATYPYQVESNASPDESGDGRGNPAMIRPGAYVLAPCDALHLHVVRRDGNGDLPCFRDLNHDAYISELEKRTAIDACEGRQVAVGVGMFANQILFHPGHDYGWSSIGCQTAAKVNVDRLVAIQDAFPYLVIDAPGLLRQTATHAAIEFSFNPPRRAEVARCTCSAQRRLLP